MSKSRNKKRKQKRKRKNMGDAKSKTSKAITIQRLNALYAKEYEGFTPISVEDGQKIKNNWDYVLKRQKKYPDDKNKYIKHYPFSDVSIISPEGTRITSSESEIHEEIIWMFSLEYNLPKRMLWMVAADKIIWNNGPEMNRSPDLIIEKDGISYGVEVTRLKRSNMATGKEVMKKGTINKKFIKDMLKPSIDLIPDRIDGKVKKVHLWPKTDKKILIVISNSIGGDSEEHANKMLFQLTAEDYNNSLGKPFDEVLII